ncbi:hypothetical protein OG618_36980 (plasmid) [Kitasatospora sp. NBC_01246]|uniref:hypothetical protein n=1 Tax=Kitasatospora sp. NBC_01246 TaxID=2903570 RepID=UPI002E358C11|nr:hypothetical protein [Kitasatospora sp. NBC_01246]
MTTEQQAPARPTEDDVQALSTFIYRQTAPGHHRGDRASSAVHNASITLRIALDDELKRDRRWSPDRWHAAWDGLVELAAPWHDAPGYRPGWARFADGKPVPR